MYDLGLYLLSSFCINSLWLFLKESLSSSLLCVYHVLFGGIFLFYTINHASDAKEYFDLGNLSYCSFKDDLNRFDITNPYIMFCSSGY